MSRFRLSAIALPLPHAARRLISTALSVVILFTQVFFAHASEISLWDARREAARNRVPAGSLASAPRLAKLTANPPFPAKPFELSAVRLPSLSAAGAPNQTLNTISHVASLAAPAATIQEIHLPQNAPRSENIPLVVLIQDIHGHADAQENIATVLARLHDWRPEAVIGIEAAAGPVDATPFRGPRVDANRFVASFLLNAGVIGGPEFAALTNPSPLPLFGVEDKTLYLANVAAVRQALPRRPALLTKALEIHKTTDAEARAAFTDGMRRFSELADGYADKKTPLGDFVTAMAAMPEFPSADVPELLRFLKALNIESRLDTTAVERERRDLVTRLCAVATRQDLESLTSAGTRFQAGAINAAAFYGILGEAAARARIRLADYPGLKTYVEYIALADRLNAERVLAEAEKAEASVWHALCRTDEQRRLVEKRRDVRLVEKLIALSLTTADWLAAQSRISELEALVGASELAAFEKFYEAAEARNAAIAGRLVDRMRAGGENTAVLVAGGFHKDGLARRLEAAGAAVVVLSPRLTDLKDPGAADYLSVFTRERTPLAEIFEAPRISLANTPALAPIDRSVRTNDDVVALVPELRAVHGIRAAHASGVKPDLSADPAAEAAMVGTRIRFDGADLTVDFLRPRPHTIGVHAATRALPANHANGGLTAHVDGDDVTVAPGGSIRDLMAFFRKLSFKIGDRWHSFSVMQTKEMGDYPVFAPKGEAIYSWARDHRMSGTIRHALYLPPTFVASAVALLTVFLHYMHPVLDQDSLARVESRLAAANAEAARWRQQALSFGLSETEIVDLETYTDAFLFSHRHTVRRDRDALLRDLLNPDVIAISLAPRPIEMDWAQRLLFPFEQWREDFLRNFSTYHRDYLNNMPENIRLKVFRPKIFSPEREAALRDFLGAARDSVGAPAVLPGTSLLQQGITLTDIVDVSSGRGHPNKSPVYRLTFRRDGTLITVFLKTYLKDAPGRDAIATRSRFEPLFYGAATVVSLPSTLVRYYAEPMDPSLGGFTLMDPIPGSPANVLVVGSGADKRLRPEFAPHHRALIEGMARWAALSDALIAGDRPAIPFVFEFNPSNFVVQAEGLKQDDPNAVVSIDHEYLFNSTDNFLLSYITRYGAGEMGTLLTVDGSQTSAGFSALSELYEQAYRAQWQIVLQNRAALEQLVAATFGEGSVQLSRFRDSLKVDPSVRLSRQRAALLLFASTLPRFSAIASAAIASSLTQMQEHIQASDAWFHSHPLIVRLKKGNLDAPGSKSGLTVHVEGDDVTAAHRQGNALTTDATYGQFSEYADWFVEMFISPWHEATDTFDPQDFLDSHPSFELWSALTRSLGVAFITLGLIVVPFALGFSLASTTPCNPVVVGILVAMISVASGRTLSDDRSRASTADRPAALLQIINGRSMRVPDQRPRLSPTERTVLYVAASPAYAGSIVTHFIYNVISNLTRVLGRLRLAPLTTGDPAPERKPRLSIDDIIDSQTTGIDRVVLRMLRDGASRMRLLVRQGLSPKQAARAVMRLRQDLGSLAQDEVEADVLAVRHRLEKIWTSITANDPAPERKPRLSIDDIIDSQTTGIDRVVLRMLRDGASRMRLLLRQGLSSKQATRAVVRLRHHLADLSDNEIDANLRALRHRLEKIWISLSAFAPTDTIMSLIHGPEWYEKYVAPLWESPVITLIVFAGPWLLIGIAAIAGLDLSSTKVFFGGVATTALVIVVWGSVVAERFTRIHLRLGRKVGEAPMIAHFWALCLTTAAAALMISSNVVGGFPASLVGFVLVLMGAYALGHTIYHLSHNITHPANERMTIAHQGSRDATADVDADPRGFEERGAKDLQSMFAASTALNIEDRERVATFMNLILDSRPVETRLVVEGMDVERTARLVREREGIGAAVNRVRARRVLSQIAIGTQTASNGRKPVTEGHQLAVLLGRQGADWSTASAVLKMFNDAHGIGVGSLTSRIRWALGRAAARAADHRNQSSISLEEGSPAAARNDDPSTIVAFDVGAFLAGGDRSVAEEHILKRARGFRARGQGDALIYLTVGKMRAEDEARITTSLLETARRAGIEPQMQAYLTASRFCAFDAAAFDPTTVFEASVAALFNYRNGSLIRAAMQSRRLSLLTDSSARVLLDDPVHGVEIFLLEAGLRAVPMLRAIEDELKGARVMATHA